jgi:hypothetical protein
MAADVKLAFAPQDYAGGRIVLMLGSHQIGAIFPNAAHGATNWNWAFWLGSRGASWGPGYMAPEKTELAAKNKLLSAAREWLQQAGIK